MDTRKAAKLSPSTKPIPPTKPVPPAVSPPRGGEWRLVLHRMGRVLRFDKAVYPDAARDTTGVRQAAWVVCVATLAVAVGTVLVAGWHLGVLLAAVLAAVLHWLIWAGVTYLIANRLFHAETTVRRLLAATGYAQTPQLIAVFGFLPVAGPWIVVLSRLGTFLAGHQALDQTAQLSASRTAATALIAFVLGLAVSALLGAWLGDLGPWEALLRP